MPRSSTRRDGTRTRLRWRCRRSRRDSPGRFAIMGAHDIIFSSNVRMAAPGHQRSPPLHCIEPTRPTGPCPCGDQARYRSVSTRACPSALTTRSSRSGAPAAMRVYRLAALTIGARLAVHRRIGQASLSYRLRLRFVHAEHNMINRRLAPVRLPLDRTLVRLVGRCARSRRQQPRRPRRPGGSFVAIRRCAPRGVDAQHLVGDEERVEPVGDEIDAHGCDDVPSGFQES
jgi:hypothetical protein